MTPLPLALLLVTTVAAEDSIRFTAYTRSDGPTEFTGRAADFIAGEVYSLRRSARPLPSWPRGPQLVLASRDRIAGSLVGGDGSRVRVRPPGGGEPWAVPLATLAAMWLAPPPAETPPDPTNYAWRPTGKRGDVVLLTNGDTIDGTVENVSADGTELRLAAERGNSPRLIRTDTVAAVAFDPTLARVRKPKGPSFHVVTADGSRLSASSLTFDGRTLTGTTMFGAKLQFVASEIVAVDVWQGKATYLSDLTPAKAESQGYAGSGWPWAADRSVKGSPLRLAGPDGGWFDKGIGTHPRTTLAYALGGKYRRFEALVGLDPTTGRRGAAAVRVLVDGRPILLPGLELLTAATLPVAVRADVTGAKELTLVVDFGPSGGVQADVNWADARLVE